MSKKSTIAHDKNNTPLTLGSLLEWTKGKSEMPATRYKNTVGTVWNDSRKVTAGDIFVAIKTDKDDGHNYVASALKAGAVAAIVDKKSKVELPLQLQKKLIKVNDPLKAIQRAANEYRKMMGILMIGVTGSSGKTTTRSFISSVLNMGINTGETYTNWNNHIGVPLSILKFAGNEWAGVIEMGANHVGEIHELSKIVEPDIAVITNIGYAHVGLFGSLDNTSKAKFEIADGLNEQNGYLLLNGDDPRLVKGIKEREMPVVFYGNSAVCDIKPHDLKIDPVKGLSFTVDGYTYKMSMPGRHFVYSALPAIYIGRCCGISEEAIAEALANQKPVSMRGTIEMKRGVRFIVDCYNANPSSMKSGLTYLNDISKPSKRVAIVGDMLELEQFSKRLHTSLGKDLASSDVKKIIVVGQFAKYVADSAIKAGFPAKSIFTAAKSEDAVEIARKNIKEGDTVLLKGSRGVYLETIFEQF
jgi:UDP-N-acetylmuramoyl-tripeptide--D-alanyl-D-alanine ligase